MSDTYNPQEIEPKWQKRWEEDRLYRAEVDPKREKYYALTMYPYPSGDLHMGHWYAMAPSDARARWMRMRGYNVLFPMGFDSFGLPAENAAIERKIHPKEWTYRNIDRMRQQLRSMGAMFDWEREAVTSDPEYYKWTQWFFLLFYKHGLAYKKMAPVDFCPKCNTTLAREQVWGEDRHCERCGTPVIKKDLDQWFFRITKYADELLDHSRIEWPERVVTMQKNWIGRSEGADVVFHTEGEDPMPVFTTRPDTLWGATFMVLAPEHPLVEKVTTEEQRAGVEAYVRQAARTTEIEREAADRPKTGVFTGGYAINPVNSRRIPIWVADYVLMTYGSGAIMGVPSHDERDFEFALEFGLPIIPVIQPTHDEVRSIVTQYNVDDDFVPALDEAGIEHRQDEGATYVTLHGDGQIDAYIKIAQEHVYPQQSVPIVGARFAFVYRDEVIGLDSVESDRAIVERDRREARTAMEILSRYPDFMREMLYHTDYGTMINSGQFSGTPGERAKAEVTKWLEEQGIGHYAINYRLRDWLISRQRYWGAPIPMIYCDTCGIVPVPEEDLPVLLPDDVEFMPTGESPLKFHAGFLNTTCPKCGEPAQRETDTMDTFMCSSWYQYRYLSPDYDKGPFDPREGAYWLPVDQYTGGIEHATMHLLYTRFFTKAMRDCGVFKGIQPTDPDVQPDTWDDEPMTRLYNQGIILGEDREKMSKSRGNVIAPDDLVREYGADTVRGYLMFAFKWDQGGPWDSQGIIGVVRFLHDVWELIVEPVTEAEGQASEQDVMALRRKTHQTIDRVSRDMADFSFNTALAALMELKNTMQRAKPTPVAHTPAWDEAVRTLLLLLAPFMPHVAEELWQRIGGPYSIHNQTWPQSDPQIATEETFTLVVQINGKLRDRIVVPVSIGEEEAKSLALASPKVQAQLKDGQPRQVIYVPGRLVNVVV
jgi:leucyl-tRNA synthetase